MKGGYGRFLIGIAVIVIVCVGLSLAAYSVRPGETVVLLSGDRVVAENIKPGLHWKIPLLGSVVRMDGRTRLSSGQIRPPSGATQGLAIAYAVAWRIADARAFYNATANDAGTVRDRLAAVLAPAARTAMIAQGAKAFLTAPSSALRDKMKTEVEPAAKKIGIEVVGVYLGTADIPDDLSAQIAKAMAAGTDKEIAAAETAGKIERNAIAADAADRRAAVLAAAAVGAAGLDGESQAKVAAIYAGAAAQAPEFFRYYLALESESAALKSNTRVFVISTDSPWFKALQSGGGHKQ